MRGKIVVAVLVIGALIFFGFGLYYFNAPSAPDARFNMNRAKIPADASDTLFFPSPPNGFLRSTHQPLVPGTQGRPMGSATYNYDTTTIDFLIQSIKGMDPKQAINSLNLLEACQHTAATITVHPEPTVPFRYSQCPGGIYEFAWVNGDWFFRASSTDQDTLLKFVNAYPF
jgi:hypothetical protein